MKEEGNEGTRERERERDDRLRKIREDRVKEPRSRISARSRNAVRDRWRASKKDDEISFDFLHFFFFFFCKYLDLSYLFVIIATRVCQIDNTL